MVCEITTRLPVGKPLDENSRIPAVREYDDYGTLQPVAAHASQRPMICSVTPSPVFQP